MSASFYDLGDRVLAVCPKAGSQSIRKAMFATRELQIHHVKDNPRRQFKDVIWFVRHPIERLASCYRYFEHTVNWADTHIRHGITWEGYVDEVLNGAKNRHWDPQVPQVTYATRFLPTIVCRFEDINELWDQVVGKGHLPHLNPSNEYSVDMTYRRKELDNFYTEDLVQWSLAKTTTWKTNPSASWSGDRTHVR